DHSTAYDDGVAYAEAFQRRCQQHAAADLWLNIELVGDLQVVHNSLKDFVQVALGREQADALQLGDDVVGSHLLESALALQRAGILHARRLVFSVSALDQNVAELRILAPAFGVVAPNARLRFEGQLLRQSIGSV